MGVNTRHPKYDEFLENWELVRDNLKGEPTVKRRGEKYLAKNRGMRDAELADLQCGWRVYDAYKMRAQFPEWLKDALRSMIGLVSTLRDKQEVETRHGQLKVLEEQATDDGFDLFELFLRGVDQGASFGRYGYLADFADGVPYVALYDTFSIINWKIGKVGGRRDLTLLVLEEQHEKDDSDEFSHETKTVYRVLDLDKQGFYRVRLMTEDGVFDEIYPMMGSKKVRFIPFVFGGSINNSHNPNPVPLLTMARSAVKYYQLSADYFQSLHLTSHPQPYMIGAEMKKEVAPDGSVIDIPPIRYTGANCVWFLDQNVKEVAYLEYQGQGIEDTRQEMTEQKNAASEAGAKVIDIGAQESGDARKARQEDQHASLQTIIQSASNAIEQILKYFAEWQGLSTDKIKFDVPLEFSAEVDAQVLNILVQMAQAQRISWESVLIYIQTGKRPEGQYADEIARIIEEQNQMPSVGNVNNSDPVFD